MPSLPLRGWRVRNAYRRTPVSAASLDAGSATARFGVVDVPLVSSAATNQPGVIELHHSQIGTVMSCAGPRGSALARGCRSTLRPCPRRFRASLFIGDRGSTCGPSSRAGSGCQFGGTQGPLRSRPPSGRLGASLAFAHLSSNGPPPVRCRRLVKWCFPCIAGCRTPRRTACSGEGVEPCAEASHR
jgi:hypothetical protein